MGSLCPWGIGKGLGWLEGPSQLPPSLTAMPVSLGATQVLVSSLCPVKDKVGGPREVSLQLFSSLSSAASHTADPFLGHALFWVFLLPPWRLLLGPLWSPQPLSVRELQGEVLGPPLSPTCTHQETSPCLSACKQLDNSPIHTQLQPRPRL